MANSDKDIKITPNTGSANLPKIEFTGADNATKTMSVANSGAISFDGDLTVTGNFTVSGTSTSVDTETVTIDDNIIVLNNNETGTPSENAGIEVERGTLLIHLFDGMKLQIDGNSLTMELTITIFHCLLNIQIIVEILLLLLPELL